MYHSNNRIGLYPFMDRREKTCHVGRAGRVVVDSVLVGLCLPDGNSLAAPLSTSSSQEQKQIAYKEALDLLKNGQAGCGEHYRCQ